MMMPRRTRLAKNDTDWLQVYTLLLAFLTTTLMIRGLTHFTPTQLVTNQLFDSSSRFVIIAHIIVIGKVIQKLLQRASAGFGVHVQQGIIAATVAVDGLKGFAVGRQVLPMLNDPLSQRGGLQTQPMVHKPNQCSPGRSWGSVLTM